MEIEEVIYDFLNEFGYTEDERIEGVIFYGSYQTNTNKEDSDVDLIIIYNSNSQKATQKEYIQYKGYNFENYQRTLQNLYDRVDKDFENY